MDFKVLCDAGVIRVQENASYPVSILPTPDYLHTYINDKQALSFGQLKVFLSKFSSMDFHGSIILFLRNAFFGAIVEMVPKRQIIMHMSYSPTLILERASLEDIHIHRESFEYHVAIVPESYNVADAIVRINTKKGTSVLLNPLHALTLRPPKKSRFETEASSVFSAMRVHPIGNRVLVLFTLREPLALHGGERLIISVSGVVAKKGRKRYLENDFLLRENKELSSHLYGILIKQYPEILPVIRLEEGLKNYLSTFCPNYLCSLYSDILLLHLLLDERKIAGLYEKEILLLRAFLILLSVFSYFYPDQVSKMAFELLLKMLNTQDSAESRLLCSALRYYKSGKDRGRLHHMDRYVHMVSELLEDEIATEADYGRLALYLSLVAIVGKIRASLTLKEEIFYELGKVISTRKGKMMPTLEFYQVLSLLPLIARERTLTLYPVYRAPDSERFRVIRFLQDYALFQEKPIITVFSETANVMYLGEREGEKVFAVISRGVPSSLIRIWPRIPRIRVFERAGEEWEEKVLKMGERYITFSLSFTGAEERVKIIKVVQGRSL